MEEEQSLNTVEQSGDNFDSNSFAEISKATEQLVGENEEQNVAKVSEMSVEQSSVVTGKESETGPFHEIENESNKETYETQFEKFLREANEGKEESNVSLKEDGKEAGNGNSVAIQPAPSFMPACEDTSNSSWYKIKSGSEEKMDARENVTPPDESSNLSVPDNGSVASSNIGDSCMSFQDHASNMDEESNLSIPEENSVSAYSGHQPVFDESANMNPPSNTPFVRPDTPSRPDTPNRPDTPSSTMDANSESTPVKRYRRGTLQIAAEDASEHGHGLTAADIFEYQWPQEKDSEYYMLQEQISMYLDVKSFKRKYPDLFRRVCDKQEKDFLRDKGVVSETQSDLGLTALKADEVHDLMSKDYPAKYKEFLKILQEREKQRMADKMKEFHALKLEKDKMAEYTKKAMRSVSDWNRSLLKKKNEERKAYFDMQTFTIHYPKSKYRKLEQSQTEVSAYPLALIPGQFQDYYRKYLPEELKYFPLNTSLFDPPKKVDASAVQHVEDDDDSQVDKGNESASDSEDSSSSSSDDDNDDGKADDDGGVKRSKKEKSSSREASKEKSAEPGIKQENECRICKDEPEVKQKQVEHEELITCSECKSKGHPTCLDLNKDMVNVIKTYPWQCMECKTCVQCMDPYDEDKMLFCDKCDRGYHTFCVGLKSLPTGQWDCFSCRGDTTPIKPLPRPTPKAKRGRKPGRPPGRPGRPPGRPPKDPSKASESPGPFKRETPGRDRRRRLREENEMKASETPVKDEQNSRDSFAINEDSRTFEKNEDSNLEIRSDDPNIPQE